MKPARGSHARRRAISSTDKYASWRSVAAGQVLKYQNRRPLRVSRIRKSLRRRPEDGVPVRAVAPKHLAAAQPLLDELRQPAVARQRDRRIIIGDGEDDRQARAAVGHVLREINGAEEMAVVHRPVAHGHVLDLTRALAPRAERVGERPADGARRLARERRRHQPVVDAAADAAVRAAARRVRARNAIAPRAGEEQVLEGVVAP